MDIYVYIMTKYLYISYIVAAIDFVVLILTDLITVE